MQLVHFSINNGILAKEYRKHPNYNHTNFNSDILGMYKRHWFLSFFVFLRYALLSLGNFTAGELI